MRLLKFLGAASLYTGRLDTPFLAEEVSEIARYEIDRYPRSHLQGILSQEVSIICKIRKNRTLVSLHLSALSTLDL